MSQPGTGLKADGERRRGRPRQIDRERIVEAALDVGLESLTMRRVAERLGVHPSALNYHVAGRDELLGAVASSVFELAWQEPWTPAPGATWREWVRAYALALRRMLLANSSLALYFQLSSGPGIGELEQFDQFVGSLVEAGFDDTTVAHATTYISQVVFMSVRDELLTRQDGGHPQDVEFARKVETVDESRLGNVRRLLAGGGHGDPDTQFEFDLDCVIDGLAVLLDRMEPPGQG
jgi:AcrR family transcriptional regulator